jgi:molecular chaperone IbpA
MKETVMNFIDYINKNSKTLPDYMLGFTFEDLFKRVPSNVGSFPPHDLEKNGNLYKLTLAVAGYSKENITIELKDNILTIVGDRYGDDTKNYIVTGIAARKFRKSFSLSDAMEVTDAALKDGLLTVTLKEIIPEEEKPKLITIK